MYVGCAGKRDFGAAERNGFVMESAVDNPSIGTPDQRQLGYQIFAGLEPLPPTQIPIQNQKESWDYEYFRRILCFFLGGLKSKGRHGIQPVALLGSL